jgi:hypothetical protein
MKSFVTLSISLGFLSSIYTVWPFSSASAMDDRPIYLERAKTRELSTGFIALIVNGYIKKVNEEATENFTFDKMKRNPSLTLEALEILQNSLPSNSKISLPERFQDDLRAYNEYLKKQIENIHKSKKDPKNGPFVEGFLKTPAYIQSHIIQKMGGHDLNNSDSDKAYSLLEATSFHNPHISPNKPILKQALDSLDWYPNGYPILNSHTIQKIKEYSARFPHYTDNQQLDQFFKKYAPLLNLNLSQAKNLLPRWMNGYLLVEVMFSGMDPKALDEMEKKYPTIWNIIDPSLMEIMSKKYSNEITKYKEYGYALETISWGKNDLPLFNEIFIKEMWGYQYGNESELEKDKELLTKYKDTINQVLSTMEKPSIKDLVDITFYWDLEKALFNYFNKNNLQELQEKRMIITNMLIDIMRAKFKNEIKEFKNKNK